MARIPGYVKDYAYEIVADLAEQLMDEKLTKEFDIASCLDDEEEKGEGGGAGEIGATNAGGGKSGGITGGKGAGQANKKSVMARLFDTDSDDEVNREVFTKNKFASGRFMFFIQQPPTACAWRRLLTPNYFAMKTFVRLAVPS